VRILASIENPYIVSYKDAFIDDNNLCIVMEYAQGGDLEVLINLFRPKSKTCNGNVHIWMSGRCGNSSVIPCKDFKHSIN
jgi:serine/threonine protein kinase